jgi:hypothetical protein
MSYIKLHKFLQDWFDNEPLINTTSNFQEYEIDVNKETIYPLANFYINETEYGQALPYKCLITLLDQVDIIPKVDNSKSLEITNHFDIINELEQVLFRFLNSLRERNNDELVFTETIGTISYLKSINRNGLSGVEVEVTFEIPNEVVNY